MALRRARPSAVGLRAQLAAGDRACAADYERRLYPDEDPVLLAAADITGFRRRAEALACGERVLVHSWELPRECRAGLGELVYLEPDGSLSPFTAG